MRATKNAFDVAFDDLEHKYKFDAKDTKRKKMRLLHQFLDDSAALNGTFVVGNKTFLVRKRQTKDREPELLITSYDVIIPGYPYTQGTYRTWTKGHVNIVNDVIVFWLRDDIPPDVFYL